VLVGKVRHCRSDAVLKISEARVHTLDAHGANLQLGSQQFNYGSARTLLFCCMAICGLVLEWHLFLDLFRQLIGGCLAYLCREFRS